MEQRPEQQGASVRSTGSEKGGNQVTVGSKVSWAEGAARDHIREVSVVFIPAHSVFGNKNDSTSHNTPEKVSGLAGSASDFRPHTVLRPVVSPSGHDLGKKKK